MTHHLLDEVKRTYRNAKYCGKEGAGTHRSAGSSGNVSNHWIKAIDNAKKAGLDWQGAMNEVRNEK